MSRASEDAGAVPADDANGDRTERPGGISRRTLIRLLVGLGIGVPIVIEGLTLLGLVGEQFGPGDGGTETSTQTSARPGVRVGDEFLPETPAADTLAAAYIVADGWEFTLSVSIENTTDRTYELRLRSVTTEDGRTVDGGGESPPIAPGERGSVTGRWDLPDGTSPASVDVVAVSRNGSVTTTEEAVVLGSVPVRGG